MDKIDLNSCLLCGKCMEVCPVFNATQKEEYSPRTKAFLLNNIDNFELSENKVKEIVRKCVGCYKCYDVCTQHLNIPDILSKMRSNSTTFKKMVYLKLIDHLSEIHPFVRMGMSILSLLPFFRHIEGLENFLDTSNNKKEFLYVRGDLKDREYRESAVVFGGCVGTFLRKDWTDKAEKLVNLRYNLLETEEKWRCCGYPFYFSGERKKGVECFKHNVELWKRMGAPKIIVFCSTCYFNLKKNVSMIEDKDLQKIWIESIIDLSEVLERIKKGLVVKNYPDLFSIHRPCHMDLKNYQKLSKVFDCLGIGYNKILDCCGFGGYGRIEEGELCELLGKRVWDKIGKGMVVSACSGCVLQLCLTSPGPRVYHWLDLVAFSK